MIKVTYNDGTEEVFPFFNGWESSYVSENIIDLTENGRKSNTSLSLINVRKITK